jgi:hypothetical protein
MWKVIEYMFGVVRWRMLLQKILGRESRAATILLRRIMLDVKETSRSRAATMILVRRITLDVKEICLILGLKESKPRSRVTIETRVVNLICRRKRWKIR